MDDRLVIVDGDVDTSVVASYERSRRELVQRGMVAAGAVLAASAVPALLSARNAFAQSQDDVTVLSSAIALEEVLAEAYQRGQDALGGVARLFRSQERAHADALTAALQQLGGQPPAANVDAKLAGLSANQSKRAIVGFLMDLENNAVRAYEDAHRMLRDARLMQTMTTILGNEAQHLAVLRQTVGREPVPAAYENGHG